MKSVVKRLSKELLSLAGLEINRTGKGLIGELFPTDKYILKINGHPLKFVPNEQERFKWIQNMSIRTVIDIGACTGGFALEMNQILPSASIYSFEPLKAPFEELCNNFNHLNKFQAFNMALGDSQGEVTIYNNDFTACSSILEVGETLKKTLPFASKTTPEVIKVNTLDKIASQLDLENEILVKIDVQGFEDKVIAGGTNTLKRTKLVILETSFLEIYKNQALFSDIYSVLVNDLGFVYVGSWSQQRNPVDGSPFQEDSMFIKNN